MAERDNERRVKRDGGREGQMMDEREFLKIFLFCCECAAIDTSLF